MRIDLNQLSFGNVGRGDNGKRVASKASNSTSPEDKASFSSDSLDLPSLEAQVLTCPDVREEKVSALRQAIQNGEYAVQPNKIAVAILQFYKR